jgi:hypothetical protein
MYEWLNGPGAVFRDARPNATNYLTAYNKQGKLKLPKGEHAGGGGDGEDLEGEGASGERYEDHRGRRRRRRGRGGDGDDEHGGMGQAVVVVPEQQQQQHLPQPFPANPHFVSFPVLDEEAREEVYQRVVVQRKTVKVVSAELGVDINRVAAVVRLKEIEKRWIKEVCFVFRS